MKALCVLFVILSIVNIPLLIFYTHGSQTQLSFSAQYANNDLGSYFATTTLGNIGQSSVSCGQTNITKVLKDEN
jgi:hypothetical protein